MYSLKDEIFFWVRTDGNGEVNLEGYCELPVGHSILMGVDRNLSDPRNQVRGLTFSYLNFFYQYVRPDPNSGKIVLNFALPDYPNQLITVFLKRWNGNGKIWVDLPGVKKQPTVLIYGSCVSRDPLQRPGSPVLEQYWARSSVASAFGEADESISLDTSKLNSAFQRRMVNGDIEKTLSFHMKKSNADWLLVDFIDERLGLGQIGNQLVTESA